jgi:hypothetical protein
MQGEQLLLPKEDSKEVFFYKRGDIAVMNTAIPGVPVQAFFITRNDLNGLWGIFIGETK